MDIPQAVDALRQDVNCEVYSPIGRPIVPMTLPGDIEEFYQLTGGAMLYRGSDYSIEIVPPERFVRANPIIAGVEGNDDISFNWFIIAQSGEQYITIDLAEERFGHCYDSFWDQHGLRGECPVIALSFLSLIEQLMAHKGGYWYWLTTDFQNLGDAYE